mmetsp:Transcript_12637/g.29484  ORF Transcript_12637/g.29484 Transcript_12637/m.29484 type:complete len:250 (+) Transcript_12637:3-752(+)
MAAPADNASVGSTRADNLERALRDRDRLIEEMEAVQNTQRGEVQSVYKQLDEALAELETERQRSRMLDTTATTPAPTHRPTRILEGSPLPADLDLLSTDKSPSELQSDLDAILEAAMAGTATPAALSQCASLARRLLFELESTRKKVVAVEAERDAEKTWATSREAVYRALEGEAQATVAAATADKAELASAMAAVVADRDQLQSHLRRAVDAAQAKDEVLKRLAKVVMWLETHRSETGARPPEDGMPG